MTKEIIFCGYGKLALECLKKLEDEGYIVKFIFTHSDQSESGLDTYAIKKSYEFTYSDSRKKLDFFKDSLKKYKNAILISINYRYILPKELFGLFVNAINIHGSLLPKYRGRTPHVWSIINGEEMAGISCHLIDEGVDTGKIIRQIEVEIENQDTGYSLLKKYEKKYPELLINSLEDLNNNKELKVQDESQATYFGKRISEMGYIDFYQPFKKINNFIRAQASPYPGAYYFLSDGRKIIINKIKISNENILINIGQVKNINSKKYTRCLDELLEIVDFEIE